MLCGSATVGTSHIDVAIMDAPVIMRFQSVVPAFPHLPPTRLAVLVNDFHVVREVVLTTFTLLEELEC